MNRVRDARLNATAQSVPLLLFGDAAVPKGVPDDAVLRANLEELLEGSLLVEADPGAGKTHLTWSLCEQTAGVMPQIIIDPEGEYAGLRRAGDYVLASAVAGEGDVLAHPATARALIRFVAERNLSVIIDLYELEEDDQQLYVARVAEELLSLPQSLWTPRLCLVEEAELFAPENGSPTSKRRLMSLRKRGRKRGVFTVLSIQRMSDFSKSVAAGTPNRLVGRTTQDTALRRAADALGLDRAGRDGLQVLPTKRFLARGPAFGVWGVAAVDTAPVAHRPSRSEARLGVPPPPPESLKDALADLAALVPTDPAPADRAAQPGYASPDPDAVEREVASRVAQRLTEATAPLEERIAELESRAAEARTYLAAAADTLGPDQDPPHTDVPREEMRVAPNTESAAGSPGRDATDAIPAQPAPPVSTEPMNALDRSFLALLRDLAQEGVPVIDRRNLLILAGRDPADARTPNGAENTALARLMRQGYVRFPLAHLAAVTRAGELRIEPVPFGEHGPLSLAVLHDRWAAHLPAAESRLLRALLDAHPDPLSRADLAARSGSKPSAGSHHRALASFANRGLANLPPRAPAHLTALLFPEGLR